MDSSWRDVTLGDLESENSGVIQTGPFGSQLHMSDYSVDGIPVVMPTNIRDMRIDATGIARVSVEHIDRLSRHKLRAGDIVYSRRGDVEKCALVSAEEAGWLCGTGCLLVRVAGDTVDSRYLAYGLSLPETREWLVRHAVGATMPNLNTSVLREVPLSIPAFATQRAIAATLGALDDKIESNRRIEKLCSDLIDAESARIATGLSTVLLSEIAHLVRDSVNPSRLGEALVDHYSLPAFDRGALADRVPAGTIMSNKLVVSESSVLVSRLNPRFDRTWWAIPDETVQGMASSEYAVLQAESLEALAAVYLAVRSPVFREEVASRVSGTSGSHQRIRPADLLTIEVPDVRRISSVQTQRILGLLERARSARIESAKLSQTRDALLPELLSGRIRVTDAA